MSKKEFRVICTKERFKDEIIIDIVPANGVIHDMIFASRKKQNPKLEDYAGSVYLTDFDNGNTPEVSFAKMQNVPKNCELYRHYKRFAEKLTPEILKVYDKMTTSGRESTLDVQIGDYFAAFQDNIEVQNLKTEELKSYAEKRLRIEKFKKQTLEQKARENAVHKPEVLMAWKQAMYRGD